MLKILSLLILISSTVCFGKANFMNLSNKNRNLSIYMENTENHKKALSKNMVPLGSAVLTRSGDLEESGIKAIAHVASGSMGSSDKDFMPNIKWVNLSLKNAFKLVEKHNYKRIAVPFIGGGIFLSRLGISKIELVKSLIEVASSHRENLEVVFVAYSKEDFKLFNTQYKAVAETLGLKKAVFLKKVVIVNGSITDFNLHKAPVIINAANSEMKFGGGISGFIGSQTGQAAIINKECGELINKLKSTP